MPLPYSNFSLIDVKNEIENNGGGSVNSLIEAFSKANSSGFDAAHSGNKNMLSNFAGYQHLTIIIAEQIELGYAVNNDNDACGNHINNERSIVYIDLGTTLSTTSKLYSSENGTLLSIVGWYSDGINVRYWNGSNLTASTGCSW